MKWVAFRGFAGRRGVFGRFGRFDAKLRVEKVVIELSHRPLLPFEPWTTQQQQAAARHFCLVAGVQEGRWSLMVALQFVGLVLFSWCSRARTGGVYL